MCFPCFLPISLERCFLVSPSPDFGNLRRVHDILICDVHQHRIHLGRDGPLGNRARGCAVVATNCRLLGRCYGRDAGLLRSTEILSHTGFKCSRFQQWLGGERQLRHTAEKSTKCVQYNEGATGTNVSRAQEYIVLSKRKNNRQVLPSNALSRACGCGLRRRRDEVKTGEAS